MMEKLVQKRKFLNVLGAKKNIKQYLIINIVQIAQEQK
jgi:hypothetical protein